MLTSLFIFLTVFFLFKIQMFYIIQLCINLLFFKFIVRINVACIHFITYLLIQVSP